MNQPPSSTHHLSSLTLRALEVGRNALVTRCSLTHSRLYILGDAADWVLTEEAKELRRITSRVGIPSCIVKGGSPRGLQHQVIFSTSQWFLPRVRDTRLFRNCKLTFAYFHGRPSPHNPEFAACLSAFQELHPRIARAQVSNRSMRTFLLNAGIPEEKLALIPIGIDIDRLGFRTKGEMARSRQELGIPSEAFVVGSFQKDGVGWGDGLEPKLIKGPDILVEVLRAIHSKIPELHVLLSGPARGYVKKHLEAQRIPYTHVYLRDAASVSKLYHSANLTLVTSRDEGGPKAVLESMAAGVPLVSTKVGQAEDLILHRENGWIANIEAVDEIASYALEVFESSHEKLLPLLLSARRTAEANAYTAQDSLWSHFFEGIVVR